MSDDEQYFDDLEFYEQKLNRTPPGRKGVKRKHDAGPERALEDAGLAGPAGAAASWTMTCVPARFEAVWLRASLASFYEEEWISDVLASVKGGKEANVYCCQAHPNTGEALLAAKVIYDFSGFFQPIDNLPILNSMKAGSAVAVRFSLAGNQGLSVLAAGSPTSQQIACGTAAAVDDVEQTVSVGNSSLSYDPASGQYSYTWKTDKAWANTCRQLIVKLADGTNHLANFKFK